MTDQRSGTIRPGLPRAEAARDLRRRSTTAEAVLWEELRDRRLSGLKFRRQRPFGPFVVDFVRMEARLVVEVDGPVHGEQVEQDAYRTEFIRSYGYRVFRVTNDEVMTSLPSTLDQITVAAKMHDRFPLSHAGERGGPQGRGEG